MTLPVSLSVNGANTATVRLGSVAILFSYDTAVAFTNGKTGESLVDPTRYSNTTAKHLTQAGYKGDPRAASRAEFEAKLAEALRGPL